MSMGDILGALADKGTLDLTKTDTTAIRNTLGIFPGGGIEDTVAAKLLELEGRIEEIAVKQNYTNDDFYIECSRNYTSIKVATENLNDTEYITILDVNGSGVLNYIRRTKYVMFNVYIDDKLVFYLTNEAIAANKTIYFGTSSVSFDGTSGIMQKVNDLSTNFNNSNSGTLYYYILPTFKNRLKVTAKKTASTASSSEILSVRYGIGGAAV